MARLPYLEADQVAPEYRDMLKRNTNLHKLLVNSPDMARAFNGIGGYIRFKSKLDPLAKAVLKGAREMVRQLAMSDSTFAEIKKDLSDEHMTDLVLTIAFYCAVVRVLATMKIDNEPYYKEVLQQYPIPGVN